MPVGVAVGSVDEGAWEGVQASVGDCDGTSEGLAVSVGAATGAKDGESNGCAVGMISVGNSDGDVTCPIIQKA